MATNGVNGQNAPKPMYDEKYLNDAKPKNNQSQSLFNNLWNEACRILENDADVNGDGVIDKSDIPLLNQLIKNLQKGQTILAKNMKKFGEYFDPVRIKSGFEVCENSLKQVIQDITNGTYVSPKDKAKEAEKAKQNNVVAQMEPSDTDAQKYNTPYFKEMDRQAGEKLKKLATDKARYDSEENWHVKHGQPYYGTTSAEAGKLAMQDISNIFLGSRVNGRYTQASEDDANYLMEWARGKFADGSINYDEEKILIDNARQALVSIQKQNAQHDNAEKPTIIDNSAPKPPKYDSANDGHDAAWAAASGKTMSLQSQIDAAIARNKELGYDDLDEIMEQRQQDQELPGSAFVRRNGAALQKTLSEEMQKELARQNEINMNMYKDE